MRGAREREREGGSVGVVRGMSVYSISCSLIDLCKEYICHS